MSLLPLNGPAVYNKVSITDTSTELKVGATALDQRAIATAQPSDGHIYYGYDSSVTSLTGTKIFKNQLITFEANDSLPIFLVADIGIAVDVRITEAG